MRMITEKAVSNFDMGKNFTRDNTTVCCSRDSEEKMVLLHGNIIFGKQGNQYYFCLCGWNTNTTRERLNGFLARFKSGVIQKNFAPYYVHNGKMVAIDSWKRYYLDDSGNIINKD